ncbi:hypothetical protein ACWIVU_08110 [Ursidibacter arcticus]
MFFSPKTIKPKDFEFPMEFVKFIQSNNFEQMSPLWQNLFNDTFLFIDYYDFLLKKFPKERYIPFGLAVDKSGIFNDGYIILSSFCIKTDRIFIYDANNEYKYLHPNNSFSGFLYNFDKWIKFASDCLLEYEQLHNNL